MTILGVTASSVLKISGSYESIASVVGDGTSATLTFSSIPSTYKHLQIRGIGKNSLSGGQANGAVQFSLQFNSDTGTNYVYHMIYSSGAGVNAAGGGGISEIYGYGNQMSNGTNMMAANIIDIHDYSSTSKYKTVRWFQGAETNAAGWSMLALSSGLWQSNSAISSIALKSGGNVWGTQSVFALYGIKGS